MYNKNWLVVGALVSTTIMAAGVSSFRDALWPHPAGQAGPVGAEAGLRDGVKRPVSTATGLGFGPTREAVLHDPGIPSTKELLNLDTCQALNDPDPQCRKRDARAAAAWGPEQWPGPFLFDMAGWRYLRDVWDAGRPGAGRVLGAGYCPVGPYQPAAGRELTRPSPVAPGGPWLP